MARTEELPGVEGEGVSPKRIKKLDNAVAQWRASVAARQELTEKEVESRDKVLAMMHAEGITQYHYYDEDDEKKLLIIEGTEKVKLKALPKEGEGDSGSDEAPDAD
jgi:hypothetical protein